MIRRLPLLFSLLLLASCVSRRPDVPNVGVAGDETDTYFGQKISDPYRWLEKEEDPAVKKWWVAQDEGARAYLNRMGRRPALLERYRELYSYDWRGVPVGRGKRLFYLSQNAKQERAVLRVESANKELKTLVDPNTWIGEKNAHLGGWVASWDGNFVAYTVVPNGNEEQTYMEVIETDTGRVSEVDRIEGAKYALPGWLGQPSWHPKQRGFYYTYYPNDPSIPQTSRQGRAIVKFHRLGTPQSEDLTIYPETGDSSALVDPFVSRDGKWLFLSVSHYPLSDKILVTSAEVKALPTFRAAFSESKSRASVFTIQDRLFNLTDWNAPNYKVMTARISGSQQSEWKNLVPERKDTIIVDIIASGGKLYVKARKDVSTEIEIYSLDGKPEGKVPLPGRGTVGGWSSSDDTLYFAFDSFLIPTTVYRLSKGGETVWWRSALPDLRDGFVVEQKRYASKDGEKIPLWIVYKKPVGERKPIPFLLHGYGAWNNSLEPAYYQKMIPWLESGGGFAIANVRGGGELGRRWHEQGSGNRKANSFEDFNKAAEYLALNGYTTAEQLAASGTSFGGLLVAGALVQRPDLYRAVLCEVPLIDMLRYHLSGIGPNWTNEFGTSARQESFQALYGYSPYHQIRTGVHYPAVLIASAAEDERVKPYHARKFYARLVATDNAPKGPILLRTQKNAGHGGAGEASSKLEELADKYGFLMEQTFSVK